MKTIIPVVLCGGSGTRLWPLSRKDTPKQFLRLMGEHSLFQQTVQRALRITSARPEDLVVLSLHEYAAQARAHLQEINPRLASHLITEPGARNTAAAFACAVSYIYRNFGPSSRALILPCDHHIQNENVLRLAIEQATCAVDKGWLTTFGTPPTRPETGYGYVGLKDPLDGGPVYTAAGFMEKPSLDTAAELIRSGQYLWSMGVHFFRADTALRAFRQHAPATLLAVEAYLENRAPKKIYDTIKPEPFEKAVLEKTENVAVMPCTVQWTDIGSWDSLWSTLPKDNGGNVQLSSQAKALLHKTQDCIVHSDNVMTACIGVKNLAIIATKDAVLVADKSCSDSIKTMATTLQKLKAPEALQAARKSFSWGSYEHLEETNDIKTVKLRIFPGAVCTLSAYEGETIGVVTAGQGQLFVHHDHTDLKPLSIFSLPASTSWKILSDPRETLEVHLYINTSAATRSEPLSMAAE
mgnify:CR=1 FL=1